MKPISLRTPLPLALLVLLGLGLQVAAQAQQAPTDLVPFKPVINSKVDPAATYVIPLDLPRVSIKIDFTGESTPLGRISGNEYAMVQQGPDGKDVYVDTISIVNAANGDGIFYSFRLLAHTGEAGYIITGGKGRYKGATGRGVMKAAPGPTEGTFICTFEGVISPPR